MSRQLSNGRFIIEGLTKTDEPTANGTVYPRAVMEEAIRRYRDRICRGYDDLGGVLQDAENVDFGVFKVSSPTHRVHNVGLDAEGKVFAEIELLGNSKALTLAKKLSEPSVLERVRVRLDGKGPMPDADGVLSSFSIDSVVIDLVTDEPFHEADKREVKRRSVRKRRDLKRE